MSDKASDKTTYASPQSIDRAATQEIKATIHRRLLETLDLVEAGRMPVEELQAECSRRVDLLLDEQRCPLSAPERQYLVR